MQKSILQRATHGFWPYVGIAALLAAAYALFGGLSEAAIKIGMAAVLAALGILAAYWFGSRRLSSARLLGLVFAAGLVLRIGYMLYTPYTERQHDLGTVYQSQNAGYIAQIFLYGRLPATNEGLFYHPPVAFFLDAAVMRLWSFFTPGSGAAELLDVTKLVPAFASCALLVVLRRLFAELGLPRRAMLIAMSVLAFHPTFFVLAASINNDMLMIFWIGVSLLYTARWYKNQTFRNILPLAVAIGLAVTTKASGLLVAPLVAAVFLVGYLRARRQGAARGLPAQFGAFFAVCLPLGLWYMVRNFVLFGQSPGYVLELAMNGPLYVGSYSFAQRFLSLGSLFSQPFCAPFDDYQLLPYVIKNSLFGEFSFLSAQSLAVPLILVNLILIVLSLAAMGFVVFAHDVPWLPRFLLGGLWVLQAGSFVLFNLQYPFGCTMDFRYIVPTLFSGAGFLGLAADRLRRRYPAAARRLLPAGGALVLVFGALSAFFYLV